jgi:predicted nucleic acid-binding protein
MPDLVIADTSCLIVLTKVDELELFHGTYSPVLIPPEVAREYGQPIPDWNLIEQPSDLAVMSLSEVKLNPGERSAIALSLDRPDALLVIDDNDARNVATVLGLRVTGTLGVIIAAKNAGAINSVIPVFEKIRSTDFYLSKEILRQAIREAGEEDYKIF